MLAQISICVSQRSFILMKHFGVKESNPGALTSGLFKGSFLAWDTSATLRKKRGR